MTTDMTRFNPVEDLRSMNLLMDRMIGGWPRWPAIVREDVDLSAIDKTLAVDIFEQNGSMVVKAALPGVDPADIDVTINDGLLQISAETKSEENVDEGDYHRREYSYGKWSRSFRLPNDVDADKAKAAFENGMLRLTIPHSKKAKGRSVKVEVKPK